MPEILYNLDLVIIFPVLCLILFSAVELGHQLANIAQRNTSTSSVNDLITSSVFGLLALIVGFTFSMALSRFEIRKDLIIKETNSISTTFMRMQLAPEPESSKMQKLMQEYLADRIQRLEKLQYDLNPALHEKMWREILSIAKRDRGPLTASLAQSYNETIDVNGETEFAAKNHVPESIYFIIVFIAFTGISLLSYNSGIKDRRHISSYLIAFLFCVTIAFIQDLDRPARGYILVNIESLKNLKLEISNPH